MFKHQIFFVKGAGMFYALCLHHAVVGVRLFGTEPVISVTFHSIRQT